MPQVLPLDEPDESFLIGTEEGVRTVPVEVPTDPSDLVKSDV